MAKKKQKTKKTFKKKVVRKTKEEKCCNKCRCGSNKSKQSKVEKLKRIAARNPKPKKRGFFGRLFGR